MDYMIIVKWTTDWNAIENDTGKVAPGIIGSMILMFIQMGNKDPNSIEADVIPDQKSTMLLMLKIAGICVPMMLLANPIVFLMTHKKEKKHVTEIELME